MRNDALRKETLKYLTQLAIGFVMFSSPIFAGTVVIVKASELRCRATPALNAKIETSFPFGMPLEISEVANSFTSIDGTAGSWMRVAKDNCWIFGGFTIPITGTGQTGGLLRMEFIHCNTGGDIGFGFPFEPLIIGDHYVAATLDSNPETPGLRPALVIGKVKRSEAGFLFKPFLEGVYDPSGKWLRQQSAGVYSQQFDSLTTKIENGQKYFTKSSLSRAQARRLCADPNQKEGVYGMYHTEQSLDLLTVRRLFPPISKNSPYPQWRNP